jgi:hypothetical protein
MNDKYYILTEEERKEDRKYTGMNREMYCLYCEKQSLLEQMLFFRSPNTKYPNYVCDESCLNLLILSRLTMERE